MVTHDFSYALVDYAKQQFVSGVATRGRFVAIVRSIPTGGRVNVVVNGKQRLQMINKVFYIASIGTNSGCIKYYFEMLNRKGQLVDRFPKSTAQLSYNC